METLAGTKGEYSCLFATKKIFIFFYFFVADPERQFALLVDHIKRLRSVVHWNISRIMVIVEVFNINEYHVLHTILDKYYIQCTRILSSVGQIVL